MNWARIMVPLSGSHTDADSLNAAAVIAKLFKAELAGIFTPPDIADLMPWMGEGFMGGIQVSALDSLREATEEGQAKAQAAMDKIDLANKTLTTLTSPVWVGPAIEGTLSDPNVFVHASARG